MPKTYNQHKEVEVTRVVFYCIFLFPITCSLLQVKISGYIGYLAKIIFEIVTRLSSIFRDSEFVAIEVLSVWSMKRTGTNVSFSISHSASKILDNFFPEKIPYVDNKRKLDFVLKSM